MGVHQCMSTGCICCNHIQKGADQFQSTATKKQYAITQYLTCKSPSVIYIIQCTKCNVQYVGKTSTILKRRFNQHRASIRNREHRPIPDHFSSNGHCLEDLIIYPIENATGPQALKERELYWIRELQTVTEGLNLGPYKCVRDQTLDDGDEGPPEGQGGPSMEGPQKGQRKFGGNGNLKSKRKKVKNKKQSVFSPETEELLLKYNDALEEGKEAISQIDTKFSVSCREEKTMSFLKRLQKKISDLKEYKCKDKIYIGLFGKTGAGKSALINAIVEEKQLLPSGSSNACTSVFVHLQANTGSKKYKADIEFISREDWESELHFLLDLLRKENDELNTAAETSEDDEMAQVAKEKITAIYGEEGLEKDYSQLVETGELPTGRRTLNFDTAKELSKSIGPYIRSDRKAGQKFWPLVKRVTISLPQSPALLDGIVLVDLPGAGDVSKHRSEMWKECLSQCSSVWIVNEINRALSEKVANEIFDKTLRTIAGGGECQNITFICTKTDIINPEEIRENYELTDEELGIDNIENRQEYENQEKQACILFRNKTLKDEISEFWKEKTKKFLLGDEGDSDEFFDVYTVSSEEFIKIEQGRSSALDRNDTELPSLMEHIKKLYVIHSLKEVKDYVSDVSGIISYLHFSKDALSSKEQSFNYQEFTRLEKELNNMCTRMDSTLHNVHKEFQKNLMSGIKAAESNCLKNAIDRVLEPRMADNRGYHRTLQALCRNDGCYRTRKGVLVDLNYTLAEPMYEEINKKSLFHKTFGTGPFRHSIHGQLASFQEDFVRNDTLQNHKKNKEKYLRLVYIRTEQRKLHKKLEKEILKRKKLIYNSLTDSIRNTMKQTYQECSDIRGNEAFMRRQEKLKNKIKDSKNVMFHKAMRKMLEEFSDLQKYLVDQMRTEMTTSLRLALSQIPDDLTGLPDVSEETEMMERCCESLGLQVF